MTCNRHNFTVIELLFSLAIIAILTSILLPSLSESRQRARFVRWLQFNKQCSADPACVINLNFQEGENDILANSAQAHEAEGFNAADYNGVINGDYAWGRGRWTKAKKALQLDGTSTYVEFPNSKHVNFAGENDFTILVSIKFDVLNKWDGIFGKCYMRNDVNGFPQYALYFDSTNANNNSDKFFQMDIGETRVLFSEEDQNNNAVKPLDNINWNQLIVRNKVVGDTQIVDLFVNGIKLKSTYKNYGSGRKQREDANLAVGCIRWLTNDNNNQSQSQSQSQSQGGGQNQNQNRNQNRNKNSSNGKPDNFVKGKIDEFLIYNRALTDNEIRGHYEMGAEHL